MTIAIGGRRTSVSTNYVRRMAAPGFIIVGLVVEGEEDSTLIVNVIIVLIVYLSEKSEEQRGNFTGDKT